MKIIRWYFLYRTEIADRVSDDKPVLVLMLDVLRIWGYKPILTPSKKMRRTRRAIKLSFN